MSASAIALAMLATLIEKAVVSRRYGDLERLCGLIDGLFDSGAGEEYLARLVEASETNATQAQHIKDALVSDLKGILTELAERQIATVSASSAQMGLTLSQTISDSLRQPLQDISGAVKQVAGSQGDAVNRLMTDVLASFAGRMESMFGGQLSGMNELLRQTAETMQATAQRFETLAGQIEQAGSGAADKMADRFETLLKSMSERQSESNAQMSSFVEQLRKMVSEGQTETAELMQSTFVELSATTSALAKQLRQESAAAAADAQRSAQDFSDKAGAALAHQGQQLSELTAAVQDSAQAMRESVSKMRSGIDENIARLSNGSDSLLGAAKTLESSLTAMTNAADAVEGGIDDLTEAAKHLNAASTSQQRALADHQQVRDAIGKMTAELGRIVEVAARDVGSNQQLVNSLERAAEKLGAAQNEAASYLDEVTETLGKTHDAFAKAVESTLQRGNAEFHKELARAIDVLRGAIQDLADTLDDLPSGNTLRRG